MLDVLIIGGGVVGCAILRELSRYPLRVALCEAESDLGAGISRANTAIAHTGFDAPPGTLEARLVTSSSRLFATLCAELGVDTRPCGALMLALDTADVARLAEYQRKAAQHGVLVEWLERTELLAQRPYLSPAVQAGLCIAGEMPVDSFALTLAYAESAVRAGADIWLDEAAVAIEQRDGALLVCTSRREVRTRFVINAAGLAAAQIAALVGDTSFTIRPRKGQLIVVDPSDAPPIDTILLPTPSPTTKGILITPAAHGNLLLGPTAEDGDDPLDWSTTSVGLAQIVAGVQRLVPELRVERPITAYAGLRSVGYERLAEAYVPADDYIVRPATGCSNMLHVAGIRSTGLSASPMLAQHVVALLVQCGLQLPTATSVGPRQQAKGGLFPDVALALNRHDPARNADQIVCGCAQITAGQVHNAIHGAIPARTLDALKRRLWVMAGPCQGARCIADLVLILAKEQGCDPSAVRKHVPGSEVLTSRVMPDGAETSHTIGEANLETDSLVSRVLAADPIQARCSALIDIIGDREQTRGSLAIPGTRPAGILTAGGVLRLMCATGRLPGSRVVLVGQAAWIVDTAEVLARAGMTVIATLAEIVEIVGWPRVTAVRPANGEWVACDLVVLTA